MQALSFPFPFENTLSDGGDDAIVTTFDLLESLGEAFIVVFQFGRPVALIIGGNEVSAGSGSGFAVTIAILAIRRRRGPVLSFTDTGILGSFGEDL